MVIELTGVQFSMLLRPLSNRGIELVPIFIRSSSWFVEKRKQKAFSSHIVHETEMMQYRASIVRFIKTQMTRFRS